MARRDLASWLHVFLIFYLLTQLSSCNGAEATSTKKQSVTPRLQWAQRKHILYLRVLCPVEIKQATIVLNDTRLVFRARAAEPSAEGEKPTLYSTTVVFYRRLESRVASWQQGRKDVQLVLPKKWSAPYWPRLYRDPRDPLKSHTGVDWNRWKPEEEDDREGGSSSISDEDLEAEEAAITASASFPDEEYDDSQLPLLANETSFIDFLDRHEVVSVLFIDRANQLSRTLHRVFASIAPHLKGRVPVAIVDGKENGRLSKKMQVSAFPMSKLFFRNGDMFPYDAKEIGYTGLLMKFLVRQLEPAWVEFETEEEALVFLNANSKAVIGRFTNRTSKEVVFETVAKRFRADADPRMHGIFAKLKGAAAELLNTDGRFKAVPQGFEGVMFVKKGETLEMYDGQDKWKILHAWVYQTQFNVLEEITQWNFKEFRRRRLPVVYVILDGNTAEHESVLAEVRQVAQQFYNKISFVFTSIKRTGDLLEHLRCEFHGYTYAVLEDFVDDYRYCIETDAEKKLSMSRIRKLCDGFIARIVSPDHVKSEAIPKKDVGPLYKVVADNLMQKAMDPTKDVVLHFYASFDENWEDQEMVLEKVAEEYEDVPTLFMGKIEGMLNERPPQFPDLGYFPCTWMFPANRKMRPVSYNSSSGSRMEFGSLTQFIREHASFPLAVPSKRDASRELGASALKTEL